VYEHDVPLDVAAVIAAVILPESPRARASEVRNRSLSTN
jgi:hypothetical protein